MLYTFTIDTTSGLVSGDAQGSFDETHPFGFVAYGKRGSCGVTDERLTAFWQAVDTVLTVNSLTPANFIRVVRAESVDGVIGEPDRS